MPEGATGGLENLGQAADGARINFEGLSRGITGTVGSVGILDRAVQSLTKSMAVAPVTAMERANYDLATSWGVNVREVRRLEVEINRVAKATDNYSRRQVQQMVQGLKQSDTLIGRMNTNVIKLAESMTNRLGRGAEETLKVITQLTQAVPRLDVAVRTGTVGFDAYFEAYQRGGSRALAALTELTIAQQTSLRTSADELRGWSAGVDQSTAKVEDFFLRTGRVIQGVFGKEINPTLSSMLSIAGQLGLAFGGIAIGYKGLRGAFGAGGGGAAGALRAQGAAAQVAGALGGGVTRVLIANTAPILVTVVGPGSYQAVGGALGPTAAAGGGAVPRIGMIPISQVPLTFRERAGAAVRGIGRRAGGFFGRHAMATRFIGGGAALAGAAALAPQAGEELGGGTIMGANVGAARTLGANLLGGVGLGAAVGGPIGAAIGALVGGVRAIIQISEQVEAVTAKLASGKSAQQVAHQMDLLQLAMDEAGDAAAKQGKDMVTQMFARTDAGDKLVKATEARIAQLKVERDWAGRMKNTAEEGGDTFERFAKLEKSRVGRIETEIATLHKQKAAQAETFAQALRVLDVEQRIAAARSAVVQAGQQMLQVTGFALGRGDVAQQQQALRAQQVAAERGMGQVRGRVIQEAGGVRPGETEEEAFVRGLEKNVALAEEYNKLQAKAIAILQQRVALLTKAQNDELARLASVRALEEARLGTAEAVGGSFIREEAHYKNIHESAKNVVVQEMVKLSIMQRRLPELAKEHGEGRANLMIEEQRVKLGQAMQQLTLTHAKLTDVGADKARFRLSILEKQIAQEKLRFGFLTGITGVEDDIGQALLDQRLLQEQIDANQAEINSKLETSVNVLTEAENKRIQELRTENDLLQMQLKRNQAQVEFNTTYGITLRQLQHEETLMQGRIELANLTKQPLLAIQGIQANINQVLVPELNLRKEALQTILQYAEEGKASSEAVRKAQLDLQQSVLKVAKAVDFVRREWSEMFTEMTLNLPTGSFQLPTGPSGFAQFGPAFMPFAQAPQGPGGAARGFGTRGGMLQNIFGQQGRTGFEQQLQQLLKGPSMELQTAGSIQQDAARALTDAASAQQDAASALIAAVGGGARRVRGRGAGSAGAVVARAAGARTVARAPIPAAGPAASTLAGFRLFGEELDPSGTINVPGDFLGQVSAMQRPGRRALTGAVGGIRTTPGMARRFREAPVPMGTTFQSTAQGSLDGMANKLNMAVDKFAKAVETPLVSEVNVGNAES